MALRLIFDNAADIPVTLRDHYKTAADGKFHLALDGEHPKVTEFRSTNVELMKERDALRAEAEAAKASVAEITGDKSYSALLAKLATFEGVDPEEYRTLKQRPDASTLEQQLATERAAHSATQLRNAITVEFLKAGGRESAIDYMVSNAAKTFAIENGALCTQEFSTTTPGERLTIQEWIGRQLTVADFAFKPSSGGGARPAPTGGVRRLGAASTAKELRDPTPQQLGQHATDIARGRLKVVYTT